MVKGRRKRSPAINNQSVLINHGLSISPMKKEIRLDDNKFDDVTPNGNAEMKTNTNGFMSISTFFIPQNINENNNTELFMIKNHLENGNFNGEIENFTENDNCKEEYDEHSLKELFKTDETPVAVPCSNPSTPHRIKMPVQISIQNDDSDARNSNEENIDVEKQLVNNEITLKPKKPAAKGKLKSKLNDKKTTNSNHKVTEYFPVRRSVRKTKKTVLEERQRDIENKVLCQVEDGLEIKHFPGKGRGIVTTRTFAKGEYVVEYLGELIDLVTAKKREAEYSHDQNTGCYMYYFQHRDRQYCVDATAETDKLGRLVNHSRNGNLIAGIVEIESTPHLVLTAKEDIPVGVEICYDYGDRSRESIINYPWLAL